jgi:hypothetical protein
MTFAIIDFLFFLFIAVSILCFLALLLFIVGRIRKNKPLSEDSCLVSLNIGDIFWDIKATPIKTERDGVIIKLEWGWTAGFTEKDWENYAEDAPAGSESVLTTLDMAKSLRNKLNSILKENDGF